jgi:hypothetical protein
MRILLLALIVAGLPAGARAQDLPAIWVGQWRITEFVVDCGSSAEPVETVYDIELAPGPVTTNPDCTGAASEDRLEISCVSETWTNGDCSWIEIRVVDWRLVGDSIEGTIHREVDFEPACPFDDVCRDSVVQGVRIATALEEGSWGALKSRYR